MLLSIDLCDVCVAFAIVVEREAGEWKDAGSTKKRRYEEDDVKGDAQCDRCEEAARTRRPKLRAAAEREQKHQTQPHRVHFLSNTVYSFAS